MSDLRPALRHLLATLAYRGGKVLRDAPPGFGSVSVGEGSRTALQTLGHVGDLFTWMLSLIEGEHWWAPDEPVQWDAEVERFFERLAAVDARLASDQPVVGSPLRLIQGPLADALTHVGQLALLRRLAGAPVKGENYFKATIEMGRVGRDQAAPVYEF